MDTEKQELNGAFEWMNRGGKEQSQRKGCGCLFLGWVLVIGGALAYFVGKEQLAPFGASAFVAVGFALGVGLCFIIFGSLWVRIRDLIRKLFGRGGSNKNNSSSSSSQTTRQIPKQNNPWTRTSTTRQNTSNQSATGIPNPWDTRQGLYTMPEEKNNERADDNATSNES
ncbi:MAG: hypothetical protein J6T94_05335 [Bacteroidaceae bacterium]|nr:hypothetical protein [Bacteroidaceae bacterium]